MEKNLNRQFWSVVLFRIFVVFFWGSLVPAILALLVSPESRSSLKGVIGAFFVLPGLIYIILLWIHDLYFESSTFWQVAIPVLFAYVFGYFNGEIHEQKNSRKKFGNIRYAKISENNPTEVVSPAVSKNQVSPENKPEVLDPQAMTLNELVLEEENLHNSIADLKLKSERIAKRIKHEEDLLDWREFEELLECQDNLNDELVEHQRRLHLVTRSISER